jgi:acetyl-CoA acetyltransferase
MTRFGKFLEKTLQDLAYEPIWSAIRESKVDLDIDMAFVGNACGLITGQNPSEVSRPAGGRNYPNTYHQC